MNYHGETEINLYRQTGSYSSLKQMAVGDYIIIMQFIMINIIIGTVLT